jgi:hypothetical protein
MWLLEDGEVDVLNLRSKLHQKLKAPAVFGDAVIAANDVPSCRDRLWGYYIPNSTVHEKCKLWRLTCRDLDAVRRLCPSIVTSYLKHVQRKLLKV